VRSLSRAGAGAQLILIVGRRKVPKSPSDGDVSKEILLELS
jgi:hypothetical protein